jgi:hypothetical protein
VYAESIFISQKPLFKNLFLSRYYSLRENVIIFTILFGFCYCRTLFVTKPNILLAYLKLVDQKMVISQWNLIFIKRITHQSKEQKNFYKKMCRFIHFSFCITSKIPKNVCFHNGSRFVLDFLRFHCRF